MGAAQGRTTQARTMLWDLLGQTIARREVKGCEYNIPKLQKDVDMPGVGVGIQGYSTNAHLFQTRHLPTVSTGRENREGTLGLRTVVFNLSKDGS